MRRAARQTPLEGELPVSLDSFVGRDHELDALHGLWRRCRQLTLVGPPGAGKSRLAVEFARHQRGGFDQTGFVDAAPLGTSAELVSAVAESLLVRERPDEPLLDTVCAELSVRRALVLFDGCEGAVDPCARLVETLLRRCPNVRILAASRELLGVSGEVTFPVRPLPLPESGVTVGPPARQKLSDAVRLFVDRAREQVPGFELSEANGRAVDAICVMLDGIPLAIELAARWVRLLSCEELLAHLGDRFDLLTVSPRTADDRHRDLRSALRSSVVRLDPRAQAVFRRLSVFAGGADLAAATAVCAGDGVPTGSVLRTICDLEAKSLLEARPLTDPAGRDRPLARFTMLESIRLYGFEQLTGSGETDATFDKLAGWLSRLVESLPEPVIAYADTLRLLEEDGDNLLRAAEWATGNGDGRHAPLIAAAARCALERDDPQAAGLLVTAALDRARDAPAIRSLVLQQAAWLEFCREHLDTAHALAREAIGIERGLDRPLMLAEALGLLGLVRLARGEFTGAHRSMEQGLDTVRPVGNLRHTARRLHHCAWAALRAGERERAAALLQELSPILLTETEPALLAAVEILGGMVELDTGDLERAESRFKRSLRADRPDRYGTPRALEGLAMVAARRAQAERTLRLLGAAAAIRGSRAEPDPVWRRSVDTAAGEAGRLLDPAAAEAFRAAGSRMTAGQAVSLAVHDAPAEPPGRARVGHDLTERECEVARLVADGMTNRQIARRLDVSPRTVDAHLQHIRDKLGLRARAQVAVWAARRLSSAPARPEAWCEGPGLCLR
ncbi:ATP-binding protein [Streptomyces sp. NPDC005017]|uniref:ATP-binding protein n=1 Tax=Streptomyces sp. NPDC005017 TaxID=3364706 RepID=UPI0036A40711